MPLDSGKAKKLLGDALAMAKKAAPGADLYASLVSGRSANTRFARSEITSTGDVEETNVSLTVAFGTRHASASTNQVDADSLRELAGAAARLAKLSPEDKEWMPPLGAQKYMKVAGAFDKPTAELAAGARASAAAAAIAAGRPGGLEVAGFHEHYATSRAIANSKGLYAFHSFTSATFTTTARTTDGTGSGWAGATSPRAADLDAGALAGVASDKAVRSASPRKLAAGRYTVVLEPAAVGELLGFMTRSLNARRADEGRSFFAKKGGGTKVGEKLFGDAITLRSDPGDAMAPSAPFSGEGLPLQPTTWIDRGTVKALARSRYWAKAHGGDPLPSVGVWHLAPGDADRAALLKGIERGVWITRFWYTRWVDPQTILITGLTRDGTFLIEKGEIVGPVNNFRFNESPVLMLGNAEAIGKQRVATPDGNMVVPALRVRDFNLASVSDAV